jgi:tripartite-type tricarboxylate transporter receptor subunit TctC
MKFNAVLVLLTLAVMNACTAKRAHAQTPYYQGKTITIVVGTISGDLYDLYARNVALFMGK